MERVSSTQNERTFGERQGAGKRTWENKGGSGEVKTRDSWANVLFECPQNKQMQEVYQSCLIEKLRKLAKG